MDCSQFFLLFPNPIRFNSLEPQPLKYSGQQIICRRALFLQFVRKQQWAMTAESKWEEQELEKTELKPPKVSQQRDHMRRDRNAFSALWQLSRWPEGSGKQDVLFHWLVQGRQRSGWALTKSEKKVFTSHGFKILYYLANKYYQCKRF